MTPPISFRHLAFLAAGLFCGLPLTRATAQQPVQRKLDLVIVQGASGTEDYGKKFQTQTQQWSEAAAKAGAHVDVIGVAENAGGTTDAQALQAKLHTLAQNAEGTLWLVLIGHGTYDGREAKFNLRGPDITPGDLAAWLQPNQKEIIIIHTGSASGAFIQPLTGPKRLVVSATKGPDEVFYCHFGEYFAPAIAGLPEADINKDKQVSLLEAFLYASRRTAEFYEKEGRIATEHALIEDNGDSLGTRAESFEGLKAKPTPDSTKPDGARAAQLALVLNAEEARLSDTTRAKRDDLERQLEALKEQRSASKMPDEAYYPALEKLLRALAEVYK